MAGHSKWTNIKHKKTLKDKKKSKIFSKLINNIKTSTKDGTDIKYNFKLKKAVIEALNNNITKEKINNLLDNINDKKDIYELIYFKNKDNVIIIIETLINENVKSDIKYILNNNSFFNITLENITKEIIKYYKTHIKTPYNEQYIFNKIKNYKFEDFLNNNIINKEKNELNNNSMLNTLKYSMTKELLITFVKNINIPNKDNKKINAMYEKLLKNTNIKNIFTNKV